MAPIRKRSTTKQASRSPSAIDNVDDVGQAPTINQEPCAPVVDNVVDAGQPSTIGEEPCTPAVDNSVDDEQSSTIIQERCSPPAGDNIFDAGGPSNEKKCRSK